MRESAQRGSLLIITLMLVIILGALAVAIGRHLSLEIRLTKARLAHQRAETLARGGVWIAAALIRQDDGELDWAGDDWASPQAITPVTGQRVVVTVVDEDRKLPLNGTTPEHFNRLERLTGSAVLAQTIIDAVDIADPAEDQPGAVPPYFAKNAAFNVPEELLGLPGIEAEQYDLLRAHTSPYVEPKAPINLNTASAETLHALGLSDVGIALILSFREGTDGAEAHADDGVFESASAVLSTLEDTVGMELITTEDRNLLSSSVFGVSSQTFLVTSEATVENPPGRVRIDAVLRRGDGPEAAPVIVAWRQL